MTVFVRETNAIKGECCVKKRGKWALLPLTVLCCIGFMGYLALTERMNDNTAPEISFASQMLVVSVDASNEELLAGVSARDEKDGDVTDSILVEGISGLGSDQLATITYAAFDEAGNVAKATRTLKYADYSSPRFSLSTALIFRSGSSVNLLKYVGAEDVIDGTLDEKVKATLVSEENVVDGVGCYEVEFRVTNSMRDTAYLTIPVELVPSGMYNAAVYLREYLTYVKKDSDFDYSDYLEELQIGAEKISLQEKPAGVSVSYDSDVNTSVPGTYSVTYTVSSGMYTGYTRLIVIVEE